MLPLGAPSVLFILQIIVSTEANEHGEHSPCVTFALHPRAFPEILSPLFSWFLITADFCRSQVSSSGLHTIVLFNFHQFRKQGAGVSVCSLLKPMVYLNGVEQKK